MSKSDPSWDHPYLRSQLIAYIGNKRSLLAFLGELFRERSSPARFLDPFAGSGAVARLAKFLGFTVAAGDWELYSYIINLAHVGVDRRELQTLFGGPGGLAKTLQELNRRGAPEAVEERVEEPYIARHFAPAATHHADYRRERLFYTRENALFLDAVRNRIEELYPGVPEEGSAFAREKALLLASLLYQAATHANTSGVFKAYHKGFGGHGKDALERIMRPMELQEPVLIDGRAPALVRHGEAEELARGSSFEVAYLDPPYTGHQYGSNYFMLNTIARWDKPPVPGERDDTGRLKHKAGIRPDWRDTRSPYCYRDTAPGALRRLVDCIDARQIFLSYNTEGIIPFEELLDIMERRGRVELFARDYTVYRGGKQSIRRATRNAELVLLVTTAETTRGSDRRRMRRVRLEQSLSRLLSGRFAPERLNTVRIEGLTLQTEDNYRITGILPPPEELSREDLEILRRKLEYAQVADHFEEVRVLGELLSAGKLAPAVLREYQRRALWCLRKFSFRRYEAQFEEAAELLSGVLDRSASDLPVLRDGLEKELTRGRRRIAG